MSIKLKITIVALKIVKWFITRGRLVGVGEQVYWDTLLESLGDNQ